MVDLRSWVVREVPSSYHAFFFFFWRVGSRAGPEPGSEGASLFFLKVVQGFF